MNDVLKSPCRDCPFLKKSMRGWLGSYKDAEEFIRVHYRHDEQNPCHMAVDYRESDWKDNLAEATACVGQQIMYRNSYKLPREWSIPSDVEESDDVFARPGEFIEHHKPCHSEPIDKSTMENFYGDWSEGK